MAVARVAQIDSCHTEGFPEVQNETEAILSIMHSNNELNTRRHTSRGL